MLFLILVGAKGAPTRHAQSLYCYLSLIIACLSKWASLAVIFVQMLIDYLHFLA